MSPIFSLFPTVLTGQIMKIKRRNSSWFKKKYGLHFTKTEQLGIVNGLSRKSTQKKWYIAFNDENFFKSFFVVRRRVMLFSICMHTSGLIRKLLDEKCRAQSLVALLDLHIQSFTWLSLTFEQIWTKVT